MHSRLDYFFTSAEGLELTQEINYLPKIFSDHNPLLLTLNVPHTLKNNLPWRLLLTFLDEDKNIVGLQSELDDFLQLNKKGDTTNIIRWGALKATIRG